MVSEDKVLKLLQSLKPDKAAGPDALPACTLKDLAVEISPILTFIFQQDFTGHRTNPIRLENCKHYPNLQEHRVTDRATPSKYHPGSITQFCSYLTEHIIFSQVMEHYDNYNILTGVHGFRPGRSCESQLTITTEDLVNSLDSREQVDAVILDFSKAFDQVPHQRLLLKLHHCGIRGPLLCGYKTS